MPLFSPTSWEPTTPSTTRAFLGVNVSYHLRMETGQVYQGVLRKDCRYEILCDLLDAEFGIIGFQRTIVVD